jgi:polysaccharide pyruvyl transferase WcaK-like protein
MRAMQGSKISFLGTGIAFNDHEVGRSAQWHRWGHVLRRAKEVHLRGPASVDFASRMGARAEVFGDFAFLLHDDAIPLKNHGERDPVIGVNLGHCLGDQQKFEDAAVELLKRISTDHRIVFHAVVHSDLEVIDRVAVRAGLDAERARIEEHYFDPLAFMQSIRRYRAFFGLKLHAAGLAMVAGVPTVMFAYLPKCHDFLAPLGARKSVVIDLPMDVDTVLASLDKVLGDPGSFAVEGRIAAIATQQRLTATRIYTADPA